MTRIAIAFLMSAALFAGSVFADSTNDAEGQLWPELKSVIDRYLGRPYSWGATGLKSFDCSGFVWRVMFESGILLKRTTARKLYFSLPRADRNSQWNSGNIVFFDDLKHCGIIAGPRSFYHAETSIGTNLSNLDPYWRRKVAGIRALPRFR